MMRTDAPSVFGGRFIPLMLAGIMALSFAACGGSGTAGAAVTDAAATDAASGAETVTESEPAEKIDLGGMEIRVRGYVEAETNANEFTVDELNGEVINDAVYNRNLAVEQSQLPHRPQHHSEMAGRRRDQKDNPGGGRRFRYLLHEERPVIFRRLRRHVHRPVHGRQHRYREAVLVSGIHRLGVHQ